MGCVFYVYIYIYAVYHHILLFFIFSQNRPSVLLSSEKLRVHHERAYFESINFAKARTGLECAKDLVDLAAGFCRVVFFCCSSFVSKPARKEIIYKDSFCAMKTFFQYQLSTNNCSIYNYIYNIIQHHHQI